MFSAAIALAVPACVLYDVLDGQIRESNCARPIEQSTAKNPKTFEMFLAPRVSATTCAHQPNRAGRTSAVLRSRRLLRRARRYWVDRILLGAILTLALVLRIHTFSTRPLWDDEAWSLSFVYLENPWKIASFGLQRFHPPLLLLTHYFVCWLSAHLLDTTIAGLRAPSVLIGEIAIAVIYKAGATLLTSEAGLIAAVFSAVNVLLIIHSQEMRMYSLFLLLSWLSIVLLARALRLRTLRWWALYGTATFFLIYTHNYAVFVLAAEMLYVLMSIPGWRARVSLLARMWAFWAAAYAPAVAIFARSLRSHVALQGGVHQPATLASLARTYQHLTMWTGSSAIFLVPIAAFILFGARRALAMRESRAAGALAVFLATAPLLMWCVSPPVLFGDEKYFIFASPALLLLFAFGLIAIPIGLRLIVIAVLLAASMPALSSYYDDAAHPAYDQAAAYVRSQNRVAAPILVGNGMRVFSYYYAGKYPRMGSEEWNSFVIQMPRRSILFDPSAKDPMRPSPSSDLYAERIAPGVFWISKSITETARELDRSAIASFWTVASSKEPLSLEDLRDSRYRLADERQFGEVVVHRYTSN